MVTNLLCTFVQSHQLNDIISNIPKSYTLSANTIFVFNDIEHPKQYYCTYNVEGTYDLNINTISIHRKSESNTLYTINALNKIIRNINNGKLEIGYKIDWSLFRNMLLTIKGDDVCRIQLNLHEIIRIS